MCQCLCSGNDCLAGVRGERHRDQYIAGSHGADLVDQCAAHALYQNSVGCQQPIGVVQRQRQAVASPQAQKIDTPCLEQSVRSRFQLLGFIQRNDGSGVGALCGIKLREPLVAALGVGLQHLSTSGVPRLH